MKGKHVPLRSCTVSESVERRGPFPSRVSLFLLLSIKLSIHWNPIGLESPLGQGGNLWIGWMWF